MIYSQSDEQTIIEKYFGNHVGVFADFGANDGITFSNTYALAKKGWKGVLVEPSFEVFHRLMENYVSFDGMRFFKGAVTGSFRGDLTFYESGTHLNKGDISLLSTVHKGAMQKWKSSGEKFEQVTVKALPVNDIITAAGFEKIDLFSIDIEGSELEILPHINFTELGTSMIVVEFNGKEKEKYDAIILPQGFRLLHKNHENLIYAV